MEKEDKYNNITPSEWFREFMQALDKSRETFEKEMAELRENQKETDRLIKANAKQIGGIDKSNGLMAEEAVYNSLEQDMTFAGIVFEDSIRNLKKYRKSLNIKGEYDIVLINGTMLAIIETKYKVREKDVSKFVDSKVADFKILYPEYANHKIVLGIGGMSFEGNSEQIAKEKGIGIIKVVGDKVEYNTDKIQIY